MQCKNKLICPFYHKKMAVHDAVYKDNVAKYCDGTPSECAIYMALMKMTFVDIPKDLFPNQTFRLKTILK